jgi:5-methylcytosine-specific restriction endonuclease McrA
MNRVLVLNASYQPLNVVSIKRAVVLVLKRKAEVLEQDGGSLHSEKLVMPIPAVIRLSYYVKVPHRDGIPLTRRTVFARDNYSCQYCGARAESIDHVIPRSRGGMHSWDNVVAACRRCNSRKENRLPEEAGLRLLRKPVKPHQHLRLIGAAAEVHPSWANYLDLAVV